MTNPKRLSLYTIVVVVFAFVGCNAFVAPLVYWAPPFSGRVIDKTTGRPLEGAVVLAEWVPYTLLYPERSKPVKAIETITDAQGGYTISGWGPRIRWWTEKLTVLDPEIAVFKSGYVPRIEFNENHSNTYVRVSDWNGRTIALEEFVGTKDQRMDQLDRLVGEAWDHKLPPRLTEEILRERGKSGVPEPYFDNVERLKRRW